MTPRLRNSIAAFALCGALPLAGCSTPIADIGREPQLSGIGIRAADRKEADTAIAKLLSGDASPRFAGMATPAASSSAPAHWRNTPAPAAAAPQTPSQKLEALLLSKNIETMLASAGAAAFGKGFAGDYWRGVLTEHVASSIVAAGRLDRPGPTA